MTFSELPKELRDDIVANRIDYFRKSVPEKVEKIGNRWFCDLVLMWCERRNYSEDGREIPKEAVSASRG